MLATRTGSVSQPSIAGDLAAYYATEQTMAAYYGQSGAPRTDISPGMATRLGIDPTQAVTQAQMANLMLGKRADGRRIQGRANRGANKDGTQKRTAFVDFTWSASKPLSTAIALAETPDERARLIGIHQRAVASAMAYVENEMAHARRGRGGRLGTESGELSWVAFDHFTARPVPGTEVPDPQTHTHVIVPNVILTKSGHVGSLDLSKLKHRTKEFGAVYQAYVARGLREHGANVELGKNGEASMPAIPRKIVEAFSARRELTEKTAKDIAKRDGLNWSELSEDQKVARRRAAMMATREHKREGEPPEHAWRQRAEGLGYQHKSPLGHHTRAELDASERRRKAYRVAAPLLAEEFGKNATLPVGKVREIVARGLVEAGIGDRPGDDISAVVKLFQELGWRQGQETTKVIIRGQSATTTLTLGQEREVIDLATKAAADRSAGINHIQLTAAKYDFLHRNPGIDSAGEQWWAQSAMMDRLTSGPRLSLGVGSAGSGKSAALTPMVAAWKAQGREVYGATLAWRQAGDLGAAGIAEDHRMALAPFLRRAQRGDIALGRNSVVVVDEVGLIGTRQALELLRLQNRHGFQIVAIGDPKQCRAVEAGSGIELLTRALGPQAIPEITSSIRQRSERDRQTAALWRNGKAFEALSRLKEDGGLYLEKTREAVIDKAAQLAGRDTLIIAASNQDARDIGMAIRQRRQDMGEVGKDAVTVHVTDRAGTFELPVAQGDRVRFFDRVHDTQHDGKRRVVAVNGDVCQVLAADRSGVTVQNERTKAQGRVEFSRITDQQTGAVRMTTGEATTIHTSQGATVDRAVFVLPSGSSGLDGFRAYTAASRHRDKVEVIVNVEAEGRAILKNEVGNRNYVTNQEVFEHMARNLGRQPEAELATVMMERAEHLQAQERASRGQGRGMEMGR